MSRIKELREAIALKSTIMPVAERQARLSQIAAADVADFVDDEGHPELKKSAAVSEYSTERGKYGVIKKLKLHSPIAAIAELNKMDHVYTESVSSVTNNTQINIYSSERGRELTQGLIKKLKGGNRGIQEQGTGEGSGQGADAEDEKA